MASIRALSLAAAAAALVAVPAYFAFAQPGDTKPAPTDAPKVQPKPGDDRPNQPQPGPDGEGRGRRGPDGQPGGPGGGRGGDGAGLPQSVKQSMSIMKRGLKTLKNQASDTAKRDENLKLISDMQRGCLAAKGLSPDRAITRSGDPTKKDEITRTYRKHLIALLEKLLKLETAVMDGKGGEAGKLIDEITAYRDESHEELGVKD